MITLLDVFDEQFKHVKFDSKLAKALYGYQIAYINSSREYLEFFGSNLLGVHVIRFKDSDVTKFFDLLDIDLYDLSKEIKKVTAINQEFKISSDVFNLTCMYLIHRFMTTPVLTEDQRRRAYYDCAILYFIRCIAAILSARFKYPADPKLAQAAYANLSYKYLIKKLGSWHKVLDYRATDFISETGIHFNDLKEFRDDAIVYAINDSANRISDIIKGYYNELMKVHVGGNKIGVSSSTFLDLEGEKVTKEKTMAVEVYAIYLNSIMSDKHSFIKDELFLLKVL